MLFDTTCFNGHLDRIEVKKILRHFPPPGETKFKVGCTTFVRSSNDATAKCGDNNQLSVYNKNSGGTTSTAVVSFCYSISVALRQFNVQL